jgi:hypothetical protein
MVAKSYRIKIINGVNEFEAEGDKVFVYEMLKRFDPQISGVLQQQLKQSEQKSVEKKSSSTIQQVGKKISIREFIQQYAIKKHTDVTLAFGYYLEKYTGVQEFSGPDINNCYYDAKMESSNTSQMIVQNIKRGFMMPSKKKGDKGINRYTLTRSGENYVENKLPKSS